MNVTEVSSDSDDLEANDDFHSPSDSNLVKGRQSSHHSRVGTCIDRVSVATNRPDVSNMTLLDIFLLLAD